MTTFTAWKFDTVGGAQEARDQLDQARRGGLVKVIDRAVLEWPEEPRPSLRHSRVTSGEAPAGGRSGGSSSGPSSSSPCSGLWRSVRGRALHQHLQGVGITKEQLETIRDQTTPGTSVLFAVTDEATSTGWASSSEGPRVTS